MLIFFALVAVALNMAAIELWIVASLTPFAELVRRCARRFLGHLGIVRSIDPGSDESAYAINAKIALEILSKGWFMHQHQREPGRYHDGSISLLNRQWARFGHESVLSVWKECFYGHRKSIFYLLHQVLQDLPSLRILETKLEHVTINGMLASLVMSLVAVSFLSMMLDCPFIYSFLKVHHSILEALFGGRESPPRHPRKFKYGQMDEAFLYTFLTDALKFHFEDNKDSMYDYLHRFMYRHHSAYIEMMRTAQGNTGTLRLPPPGTPVRLPEAEADDDEEDTGSVSDIEGDYNEVLTGVSNLTF